MTLKILKTFKYFLEAVFVLTLFILFKLLGHKISSQVGCFLFKQIGFLFRSNSKILSNIKNVYPNLENKDKEKIVEDMWCNYGRTFSEYMFLNQLNQNSSYIKIINPEKFLELKNENKPILFFSGHFANFELMAMQIYKAGFDIHALYRPLNNYFLDPLMLYLRKKYICPNQIPKAIPGRGKEGTKTLLSKIKEGKHLAIMVDQKVSQGLVVDFFNKPSLTISIPATLSLKHNYLLVPVRLKRFDKYFFEFIIDEPLKVSSNDNEKSILLKMNKKIEEILLDNPNQWIWTHSRWKL